MALQLVGLAEVGAYLRDCREQMGLSAEEAAFMLRIKPAYVAWIEAGEWENLPAQAYARAYVLKYCQYLGVDSAFVMAACDAAMQRKQHAIYGSSAARTGSTPPSTRPALVVALLIGAVALWLLWQLVAPLWQHSASQGAQPVEAEDPAPLAIAQPARVYGQSSEIPFFARKCWQIMPLALPNQPPVCYWRPMPDWLGMVPQRRYDTQLTFSFYTLTDPLP